VEFVINNLPIIICAVLGIILLFVEMFTPGFGLAGTAGFLLMAAAIVLTWLEYGPLAGLGATVIVIALSAIMVSVSLKSAASGRISRSALILKDGQSRDEGYRSSDDLGRHLGKTGVTYTVLRPAGTADIEGERVNVVSMGEFIDKGVTIRVEQVEGARVLVKRISLY
jgi:membrane-bound ClpP family serine protease